MAPSLRKRLSKQPVEPVDKKSKKPSSSPLLAAIDHLQRPRTSNNETMDTTPPLLEQFTLPKEPEKAKRSPSKSLLERYKGGTPASKIQTTTPSSESIATLTLRPKIPAFKENFDHDNKRSPASGGPQSEVAETPQPDRPTIRTVGGVDFQMLNSTQASAGLQRRGRSAEPTSLSGSVSDQDTQHRRTTRSETRRKERADSTTEVKDFATLSGPASIQFENTKPDNTKTEVPRVRATLKKRSKSEPSSPSKPQIRRSTRFYNHQTQSETTTPSKTRQPIDSDMSSSSSSSSSSSCDFILDFNAAEVGSPGEKKRISIPTRVRPPVAMPNIHPGMVWLSPLSGTSRPGIEWGYTKRWTCCKCAGMTIVEQTVCSRLTCVHRRCGARCVISEGIPRSVPDGTPRRVPIL